MPADERDTPAFASCRGEALRAALSRPSFGRGGLFFWGGATLTASGRTCPVSGLQQSLSICRDPHAQEGFAMKVLALATQKGGTGKSSLAVALAVAAQERSLKVYVVDLDPQATARKWFERREAEGPEVSRRTVNGRRYARNSE